MNVKSKLVGVIPNESTPLSRAIFFIVLGVAFYLLDRFSLFIVDDYDYSFIFGTTERIETLKDILVSQRDHYMLRNGRFLVHCVVQLFCGILGIEWFRIINTMMFVLFCAMTTQLVCGTKRTPIMWYALTAFAIWLFIPRIGCTVLGNIACCVNYLWVGVASLAFILLHQKIADKKCSTIANIGLGIVGIVVGSLQESFSIPIAGTLFIYYCFNYKKFKGPIAWLVCGYWLGSVVLVFAPGNFVRLHDETSAESIIITSLRRVFAILKSCWLLMVAIVIHLILWWKKCIQLKQFISQNAIWYGMLLIGLMFTIVIAYTGGHQLFFIGWLLILLMLKLFYAKYNSISVKIQQVLISVIVICMIPIYGYASRYREKDYKLREQLISTIKKSQDGNIVAGDWYVNDMDKSLFESRYAIITNFEPKKSLTSLYYTGDTVHLNNYIPCSLEELESKINIITPISSNVWYLEDYYCYVVKVPMSIPIEQVKIEATYPIVGISKIKRKLTKEPLTIDYILNDKQIRDVIQYKDNQYAIIWQPYNGKILDLKIVE